MKVPFEVKVTVPCVGELTRVAVRLSPSGSVSFEIIEIAPVEVIETVPPKATFAESFTPTGGSLVGEILMVTVTVFPSEVPSFDL
jgi:hypothetical protein